jgi:hypothetical protein
MTRTNITKAAALAMLGITLTLSTAALAQTTSNPQEPKSGGVRFAPDSSTTGVVVITTLMAALGII